MKLMILFYAILALWGCTTASFSEKDLRYLNGYWEITEVVFPDGTKKQYTVNPSIDFIYLNAGKGFRKKMQPKFNGTYSTSHNVTSVTLKPTKDTFILQYKNDFSTVEETLVRLDSTTFSVVNNEGTLYSYHRFTPITLPQ